MIPYFCVGIVLVLLCFFKNKKLLIVSYSLLLIFGGMRDIEVGTDTMSYAKLFLYGKDTELMQHATEPLYILLQLFVVHNRWEYEAMVFITMGLILTPLFYFVYKASPLPHLSILCYYSLCFYFYSFNISRQYLAIPLVLFAFNSLEKEKKGIFFLLMFIASMFHYSAIFAMLVWPFEKMVRNKDGILIVMIILTFFVGITPLVQNFVMPLSSLFPSFSFYAETNFGMRESLFSFTRLLLNLYVITLIVYVHFPDRFKLIIMTLGVCLLNLFAFNPTFGRLCQYFTIIQVIIIPTIISYSRMSGKYLRLSVASLLYIFVVFVFLLNNNVGGVVPYKFGW